MPAAMKSMSTCRVSRTIDVSWYPVVSMPIDRREDAIVVLLQSNPAVQRSGQVAQVKHSRGPHPAEYPAFLNKTPST